MRPTPRIPRRLLILAVLVGPVLGFAAHHRAVSVEREQALDHLAIRAAGVASAIESEIRADLEILYSLKFHLETIDSLTSAEFSRLAQPFLIRHTCTRALGWIPHVSRNARPEHEHRMREAGFPDYAINQRTSAGEIVAADERDDYFPVSLIFSLEGSESALGFDITSEEIRARALVRAATSGQPTLTDPITLGQGSTSSQGVLGLLAVTGHDLGAVPPGKTNPRGFVLAVYHFEDLLHKTRIDRGDAPLTRLRYELVDEEMEGQVLFTDGSPRNLDGPSNRGITGRHPIDIGGQHWWLVARPSADYLASFHTQQPLMLGVSAAVGWELLVGFFIVLGKRSQDRLKRRHARRVTHILESLKDGVIVADSQGEILFTNTAAASVFGPKRSDIPISAWSTEHGFFLPTTNQPFPTDDLPLARAIRGESIDDVELQILNQQVPNGIQVSVRGGPILDGEGLVRGGVVVFRDITERKKTDEHLKRLSSAVEQTADAVVITDRAGTIEYVNPAFETSTGFSIEEALGKNPRILNSGLQSREFYRDLWDTVLRGDTFRGMTVNRRKDGDLYHAEQTITPMTDDRGEITHFVSVLKDMTERRKIQEQEIELELASMVQLRLYPNTQPEVPGYDVAGAVFPAEATCGDYFDFVPLPGGALALVVADVSGHGLGPALVMAETRAYLRSLTRATDDLAAITTGINGFLFDDLQEDFFVTMLIARLNPLTGRLTYVNSAHPSGYVMSSFGDVIAELPSKCLPLGLFLEEWRCVAQEAIIGEGELAVFMTDGVLECESPDGTEFGGDRLLEVVSKHRQATAQEIVQKVYHAVRSFSQREKQADDVTIVVCKRDSSTG